MRVLGAVLMVAAAGCIPERNNPHDPSRAPHAVIEAQICEPGADPALDCPEGIEGVRSTSFRFDASDSRDPHGSAADLRFSWDLDGTGSFARETGAVPYVLTTVGLPAAALPASGGGSAVRDIRVRVTAPGGRRGDATVSVILQNRAPVVDPGEDLYVPVGEGTAVMLDACGGMPPERCTSADPDGDPITWTWERVDGPMPAGAVVSGPGLQFPSGTEGTMYFRLTGDDGLARASAITRVVTGSQIWVSTSIPSQLFRLTPDFASAVDSTGEIFSIATDPANGDIWAADYGPVLRVFSPDLAVVKESLTWVDVPALPTNTFFQSVVKTGYGACAGFQSSRIGFLRLDGQAQPLGPPAIAPNGETNRALVLPSSIPDTCWAITEDGVFLFASDNSLDPVLPLGGGYISATTTSDGALWFSEDFGDIRRLEVDGSEEVILVAENVGPLAADPGGDGVWYGDWLTRRLVHVHSDGTPETLPLIDVFAHHIVGDPGDRSLWVVDGYRAAVLHLVDTGNGYVLDKEATFPTWNLAELRPMTAALDAATHRLLLGVARNTGAGGGVLAVPPSMERVEVVPFAAAGNSFGISIEPTRGTLWTSGYIVPLVERIADSGRALAQVQADPDGTIGPVFALDDGSAWFAEIPNVGLGGNFVKASPTGEILQSVAFPGHTVIFGDGDETGMCVVLDLNGGGAKMGRIAFDTGTPALTILDNFQSINNAKPATAPDGSCWFFDEPAFAPCVTETRVLHYPVGAVAPDVAADINRCPVAIAADPLDSTAWVASSDGGTRYVEHVGLGGSITEVAVPLPAVDAMHVRKRCNDAGDLACRELWYFSGSVVHKALGSAPGVVIDSFDLPQVGSLSSGGFTARP